MRRLDLEMGVFVAEGNFGAETFVKRDQAMTAREAVPLEATHNTAALGLLIYDQYFLLFQLAGLILLVAMIGAIVLTLRHRADVKRQDVHAQMWRDPATAMELKDVKPGDGL